MTTRPLLGILGGMGPEAAVYFYQLILKKTAAKCDQDHIPTLNYQATFLPDRVEMINAGKNDEFLVELRCALATLYKANISCLAVPCNTVHYFLNQLRDEITLPFFHLIDGCIEHLVNQNIKSATLLSTIGTIQTRLYHEGAEKKGITLHVPDSDDQFQVSNAIKKIKGGQPAEDFATKLQLILERLAQTNGPNFILGCTELPLIFQQKNRPDNHDHLRLIDPMEAIAEQVCEHFKQAELTRKEIKA
ncbi:MAG: amino acid racemase [bacterium]